MLKLKKIFIKSLNGCIFVEPYNSKNNEEQDRAKIYDSNMQYLDYIALDNLTPKGYDDILKEYKQVNDISDLIENCLFCTSYDYSKNLEYLLYSVLDGQEDCVIAEFESDLRTLSENEILSKYMINRIGDNYFYLGIY